MEKATSPPVIMRYILGKLVENSGSPWAVLGKKDLDATSRAWCPGSSREQNGKALPTRALIGWMGGPWRVRMQTSSRPWAT